MFQEALRDIVDRIEGGVAGLVMDNSGIAVDSYSRDDAPFPVTTATCAALTDALADSMAPTAQAAVARRTLIHFVRFISFNPVY